VCSSSLQSSVLERPSSDVQFVSRYWARYWPGGLECNSLVQRIAVRILILDPGIEMEEVRRRNTC
jgi:hypothetical protein